MDSTRLDRRGSLTALLARAESVEARAWADLVHAAPPEVRRSAGLTVETVGEGCIVSATGLHSLLFNRAIALGAGSASDHLAAVDRALRHYRERRIGRFLLQLGPVAREREMSALLHGHGIERYRRAWDKFVRRARAPLPFIATDLSIRAARPADADPGGRLLADSFETGAHSAPLFAALIDRPRWRVLVACAPDDPEGRPRAVAGLFMDGDWGHLAFAGTDPEHRRRGAQGALMVRRIREAAAHGCRWLTTETGEPMAGEPSPSRRNMLRCGFHIAQRRDNFVPIGVTWAPIA